MTVLAWLTAGGVMVALLGLAWQMRRANHDDRDRQQQAALEEIRRRTEFEGRVERNTTQLADHEKRLRKLERDEN